MRQNNKTKIEIRKQIEASLRVLQKIHVMFYLRTVKLDYNDHGYNEFKVITNELCSAFWPQLMDLLHKRSRL